MAADPLDLSNCPFLSISDLIPVSILMRGKCETICISFRSDCLILRVHLFDILGLVGWKGVLG
jgi:hypothetical protein